jgi:hypothetical protein
MAIVSFFETGMSAGTINTSATFTAQHNFGSGLTVWSRPYLQSVSVNDDDGSAELSVSKFVDNSGTHHGPFQPGIFASKCTSITFRLHTVDCIADAVLTTEIFG